MAEAVRAFPIAEDCAKVVDNLADPGALGWKWVVSLGHRVLRRL